MSRPSPEREKPPFFEVSETCEVLRFDNPWIEINSMFLDLARRFAEKSSLIRSLL